MDGQTLAQAIATLMQLRNAVRSRSMARTIAAETACLALAVGAVAAALGCLAVALWCLALPSLGPVWTPALVALAFVLVAAIALLAIGRIAGRRRPPAVDPARFAESIGKQLAEALPAATELGRLAKDHAATLALAGLVAGLVAGGSGPGGHRR